MVEQLKANNIVLVGLKKVLLFPFTLIKYSTEGISFIKRKIKKQGFDFSAVDKIDGEELNQELDKVKKQSEEFKNKITLKEEKNKNYSFNYIVKNEFGETVKGSFEGPSLEAVKVFLEGEYEDVLSIKPREKWDIDINIGGKFKADTLAFFLTQLATYLRAGITLVDGIRIMVKQTVKPYEKKVYSKIVYSLVGGDTFSKALSLQSKVFPEFLISMVKTSELTGDLPSVLDEMADYYTKIDKNKRSLRAALSYPLIIFMVAIGAVVFLLTEVVPKFQDMFSSVNGKLPGITIFVLQMSSLIQKYGLYLFIGAILGVSMFIWFYKNNRVFKKKVQTVFMKFPVFGELIICNEVSNLTRTFATLLNHGVFITDSMEILSAITTNEVYKSIIYRTLIGLSKGAKISETFKGEWAFPIVAYEMLATGEATGQLPEMMSKVSTHFADIHEAKTSSLKSLMEPFIILFLATIIGFILLAVIVPMFSLYNQI